jgi:hypothetical protein
MSLRAKEEYLRAVHGRYRQATRAAKGQILDEFCATTGYHRKSALRLLHGPPPGGTRPRRRAATGSGALVALTDARSVCTITRSPVWHRVGEPGWSSHRLFS